MVDKILRKSLLARKISWRVSDSAIDLWPKSFNKLDKASYPTRIVKGPRDPVCLFFILLRQDTSCFGIFICKLDLLVMTMTRMMFLMIFLYTDCDVLSLRTLMLIFVDE